MNKAELVAAIAADTNLSKADAGRALFRGEGPPSACGEP